MSTREYDDDGYDADDAEEHISAETNKIFVKESMRRIISVLGLVLLRLGFWAFRLFLVVVGLLAVGNRLLIVITIVTVAASWAHRAYRLGQMHERRQHLTEDQRDAKLDQTIKQHPLATPLSRFLLAQSMVLSLAATFGAVVWLGLPLGLLMGGLLVALAVGLPFVDMLSSRRAWAIARLSRPGPRDTPEI